MASVGTSVRLAGYGHLPSLPSGGEENTRAAGWAQAEGSHRLCWEACRLVADRELSVLVVAPEAGLWREGVGHRRWQEQKMTGR